MITDRISHIKCPLCDAVRHREDLQQHLVGVHGWAKAGTWTKKSDLPHKPD